MSIISLPSALRMRHFELELDRPAQINVSAYTGARKVVANPWHGKWTAKVDFAQIQGEANFLLWRSFLSKLKGRVNTFRLPVTETAQNANTGVMVNATAAQGATSITLTNLTTALSEGQFVTINGQLLNVTVAGTLVSGIQTISFEPQLRAQALGGTTAVTSNPYALMCLADSKYRYSLDPARLYNTSLDVEEAISDSETAAPEAFNPATLFSSNTGCWYDPSDLSSMWQDSAGTIAAVVDSPVGKINDKSGNGNHATQATSSKRPVLRLSGGYYYLEFDGVDDYLAVAFTFNQPVDRVSAIRQITWTAGDHVFSGVAGSASVLFQDTTTPRLSLYDGTIACANTDAAVGSDVAVTERHNNASSRLAINNGSYTTGTTNVGNPGGFSMGSDNAGAANGNVRIYGALTIGRAMSDAEISLLRLYMAAKAGVAL